MSKLVEEQVLVDPKHIGRLFVRNCDLLTVPAHPDEPLHKRRSRVWFTIWIPLDDCPTNLGPLQRLERPDRFGVIEQENENICVP